MVYDAAYIIAQTQDEWLPPVKAFSYSIIEDLGMEETFDDLTGVTFVCSSTNVNVHIFLISPPPQWLHQMSIDPNLRDYLGAVFLDVDSRSGRYIKLLGHYSVSTCRVTIF